MKAKTNLAGAFASALLSLVLATGASAYNVLLPDDACSPPTPYPAIADHHSGPACVQMALNCCPDVTERALHDQDDLYTSILAHNTEPPALGWFSDPHGMVGALSDPALSPCGHWVDFSSTDKQTALGNVLYWLKVFRYFAPVSIGDGEHWVTVIGYQSDVEPTSSTSTVALQDVFFYDPLSGEESNRWVSGTEWLETAELWGVPHDRPGSAWHDKYIAVVEPPPFLIRVVAKRWVRSGRLLSPEEILRHVRRWQEDLPRAAVLPKAFEALRGGIRPRRPLLVAAEGYSYYLVELEDRRFVAVFNAYDGSFEEVRASDKPRTAFFDPGIVAGSLRAVLRSHGVEPVDLAAPRLVHRGDVSPVGRTSPRWEVAARLRDAEGVKSVTFRLNAAGQVTAGLERLVAKPEPEPWVPHGRRQRNLELYAGYYDAGGRVGEELTYGLRGGVRTGAFGLQATLGRVDTSVSEGGPDIDLELTLLDLSAVGYLRGGERGELLVYGGPGWAWLDVGGASQNSLTLHAGLGWIYPLGHGAYLRPDVRVRWFERRPARTGEVDRELTLAIGWRW